jgi:hypothetical protein
MPKSFTEQPAALARLAGSGNTGLRVCGQALDAAGGRGRRSVTWPWAEVSAASLDQSRSGVVNTCAAAMLSHATPGLGHTLLREGSPLRWSMPLSARPSTYACDTRRSCHDSPRPPSARSGCQRRAREGQRGVKNHGVARYPTRSSHTTTRVFGVGTLHARQTRVHFGTLEKIVDIVLFVGYSFRG